jgi:CubicO group peptidase (beta-lactamase class C family)
MVQHHHDMPELTSTGAEELQNTLDELAKTLPGVYLAVATPSSILFSGQSGQYDILDHGASSRQASVDDILWFASTTKLLTTVCYLQLVDRGLITLDTDMRELYPSLKEATSRILDGFDEQGQGIFRVNADKVTLRMMLNQTSGFGQEFGDKIKAWKKVTDKGRGFVNSCKVVRYTMFYS